MNPRLRTILLVLAGWSLWGLFNASRLQFVADHDGPTALRYGLPDAWIWAALTPIPVWLASRFPLGASSPLRAIGAHAGAAVLLAAVHSAADAQISLMLGGVGFDFTMWSALFAKLFRYMFHINVMLYGLVIGIAYYHAHQKKTRQRDRQEAELRAQLSEARLDTLRMQLRPHFLFNVLHTISGLMEVDPAAGRKVVRQLGDLLRMSLVADQVNEVPLKRELHFVRLYLELEQARFRDRLVVDIDAAPGTGDSAVPVLILQPLVENAVIHGIDRRASGGRVRVRARRVEGRLEVEVEDNGPGLEGPSHRTGCGGVGLANTRARLRALYHDEQELTIQEIKDGGVRAVISIPHREIPGSGESRVA